MKDNVRSAREYTNDVVSEISRLRDQLEELAGSQAKALNGMREPAAEAVRSAMATVRSSSGTLASTVREQPIMALLVAASVAFLVGRITR